MRMVMDGGGGGWVGGVDIIYNIYIYIVFVLLWLCDLIMWFDYVSWLCDLIMWVDYVRYYHIRSMVDYVNGLGQMISHWRMREYLMVFWSRPKKDSILYREEK